MNAFRKVLFAFLVAPMIGPLLLMLFFLVMGLLTPESVTMSDAWKIAVYSGLFSALLSYIYFIVCFLPAYLLLRFKGWVSRKNLGTAGFASGCVFGLIMIIWWNFGVWSVVKTGAFELLLLFLYFSFFATYGWLIGWLFGRVTVPKISQVVEPQVDEN